jgi:glycosyltransferase involved in cell wall biosynthesis
MTTLSVVIPCLNEEVAIPRLLDALNAQTRPPDQIIVADAGSKDNTQALARERGALVVPGGRPGPGRNAGARAATSDLIFFLDADVLPEPVFLEKALAEFESHDLSVATCTIKPLEKDATNKMIAEATNLYMQVVQYFSPHAPGFCILIKRSIHEAIGGFDEEVKLAEDHEYVQRAAKEGEFGVLRHAHITVSMRRVEKEGLAKLAFKYLWCEMYALAGKPIYSTPFEYEFGTFQDAVEGKSSSWRLMDIGELREQLGRFENPIHRVSEKGLNRVDEWLRAEWIEDAKERLQLLMEPPDSDTMRRYLLRRLALIRRTPRPLREALAKIQSLPVKEQIRLLDKKIFAKLPGTDILRKNRDVEQRSDNQQETS